VHVPVAETVTVIFVVVLATGNEESTLVTAFVFGVVVLTEVTVIVTGACEVAVIAFDEDEEMLLDCDEVRVEDVEGFEDVEDFEDVEGFEDVLEALLDFKDEIVLDEVAGCEEVLELLGFEDDLEVEELVDLCGELEVTLLVFEGEVTLLVFEDEVAELVDLIDEVEELLFEFEVLRIGLLLDVDVVLDEVELELALDVLEVTTGVAVHCPVDEGTALTPEPIGMMFDPQLAA
jgi:hypothetical protein